MKTYILDPISDEALAYAQERLDVVRWDDEKIKDYKEVEAVIVRVFKMTSEVIDQMPNLKIIAKHGVGVDNIDIPYANSKKIRVTNTPEANMNSVAEQAIALTFDCARRLTQCHLALQKGLEKVAPLPLGGFELAGKTLGLIGLGKIGMSIGKKLSKGFDMKVVVYDPFTTASQCEKLGFSKVETVDELCSTADVISISVPLTETTRNMISSREFSLMKKTAILINTARGGIVNEDALYEALQTKQIFGAGFDVFVQEPLANNHKLFSCENFVATPHNGANTRDALIRMGTGAVDEILRCANNQVALAQF